MKGLAAPSPFAAKKSPLSPKIQIDGLSSVYGVIEARAVGKTLSIKSELSVREVMRMGWNHAKLESFCMSGCLPYPHGLGTSMGLLLGESRKSLRGLEDRGTISALLSSIKHDLKQTEKNKLKVPHITSEDTHQHHLSILTKD